MSGIFPATRHKSPPGRGGFMDEGIGERFLRETRHSRGHLVGGRTDWARQPSWFKSYPEAPRVALPPLTSGAGAPADAGLFDVLARRRSVREYGPPPLDLEELGGLLWAAAGVTARQVGFAFRTAPSAGGLFPIEHYVVANSVTGLEPGVYHYAVLDEALELLRGGDHRLTVAHAALEHGRPHEHGVRRGGPAGRGRGRGAGG